MELYFSPFGGILPRPRRLQRRGSLWGGWHSLSANRALAAVKQWHRRIYERRLLAGFSDRDRRDLALTVADIGQEIAKPFWRG